MEKQTNLTTVPGQKSSLTMMDSDCNPANTELLYRVNPKDLPVSCPMPSMCLWNSHPRVYLAFDKDGRARCPYCSAEYLLDADKKEVS